MESLKPISLAVCNVFDSSSVADSIQEFEYSKLAVAATEALAKMAFASAATVTDVPAVKAEVCELVKLFDTVID